MYVCNAFFHVLVVIILTAYLVSFLNLLNRVQSCNENHLILGANCEEDHPLMKTYTQRLTTEMEEVENQLLTTEKGYQVKFVFKLIPSDMKWASSFSGELNNAATYFSPFANVSQSNKNTIFGSIGGSGATWQPWSYEKRLEVARKVENFKKRLKDPDGKQRSEVTKFIAQNKSRQEYVPPPGKYVTLIKPDPLHSINNGWQQWFTNCLTIAMQYTDSNKLKAAVVMSDLPTSCCLVKFFNCVKERMKCGRLYKNFCRWFSEKRKKGIPYSYRFTGLESKRFCWNFGFVIEVLLGINNLSASTKVNLHALAFTALQLRDSGSLFSRVEISKEQLAELESTCQNYFIANSLLLRGVNPTVWTIGYAIPYCTQQLFKESGFGLGLNSMQGREAKHIKLASYVQNTCNVNKNQRWWMVFRHEYLSLVWLREIDPYSITYRPEKKKACDSYIPKRVAEKHALYCYCGLQKSNSDDDKCSICMSSTMKLVNEAITKGKIPPALRKLF